MNSVEHRLEEFALLGEFGGIRLLERFEILSLPDDGGKLREMGNAEVLGPDRRRAYPTFRRIAG